MLRRNIWPNGIRCKVWWQPRNDDVNNNDDDDNGDDDDVRDCVTMFAVPDLD